MDTNEWIRLVYGEVLNELEKACSRMGRAHANGLDLHDSQRSEMFHLGTTGGLAFSGRLPGIESEALFDDISDTAEKRDLERLDEIRRRIEARLTSDHSPDEPSPGEGHLDWEAGPLQMLAVLNEACTAREDGDAYRYSLMAGFLVGLLSTRAGSGIRYRHGSLKDAVLAAHDSNPERARRWVEAESIRAGVREEGSAEVDPRVHLFEWMKARLAAAHRLSGPMFLHSTNETEDERRAREEGERRYFEKEEDSIRRAQNFGRRISGPDDEGIWVPGSYSLNRALVLESHEEHDPIDGNDES